jgi:hypothetical protein
MFYEIFRAKQFRDFVQFRPAETFPSHFVIKVLRRILKPGRIHAPGKFRLRNIPLVNKGDTTMKETHGCAATWALTGSSWRSRWQGALCC